MENTMKNRENRIRQRLKNLEVKNKFQKHIARLRASSEIPPAGFKNLQERDNSFLNRNSLIHSISREGKNYRDEDNNDLEYDIEARYSFEDVSEYEGQSKYLLENNKEYEFKSVLEKFKLSKLYEEFIVNYVYFNDFFHSKVEGAAKDNLRVGWFIKPDSNNKGKIRIFLEIYSDTTSKDLVAIYNKSLIKLKKDAIGYEEKGAYKHFQSEKNIEIDSRIEQLQNEGMKSKEINKIITEEFDKKLGYEYVLKRLNRFRKRK